MSTKTNQNLYLRNLCYRYKPIRYCFELCS